MAESLDRARASAESTLDRVVLREPEDTPEEPGLQVAMTLATRVAQALVDNGVPTHRVEDALHRLSSRLGFEAAAFGMPTGLILTLGRDGAFETRVVPAKPGDADLEKVSALHRLIGRVESGELSASEASERLSEILARPPAYGGLLRFAAYGLAAAAFGRLLGGGLVDVMGCASLGLVVGLLHRLGARSLVVGRLLPALAAVIVSVGAALLARAGLPIRTEILLLAALMVLMPGLTMTIAMLELATLHLVSGTARFMAATMTLLQLGFGALLGQRLVNLMPALTSAPAGPELPAWTRALAPFVAAVAFIVLLRVRLRDGPWVLVACTIAVGSSQLVGPLLGAEVGALVGAFAVGIAAHAFARWRDQPVVLLLVPGILTLVPGSVGFLGIRRMLEADTITGIDTGLRMLLIAVALAVGVMLSTLALPPRRAL